MVLRSTVQDSSVTTVKQRVLSRDSGFSQIYAKTVMETKQEYQKIFKTIPHEELTSIFHIFGIEEKEIELLINQATYLILNKIFSYSMLRAQLQIQYGVSIPKLSSTEKNQSIHAHFSKLFQMMVTDFEFAPIFRADALFPALVFTTLLAKTLQKFAIHLEGMEFTQIQHDFIASFYELLLPGKNKKLLGEIYTPPDLAEIMVKLAVQKEGDTVLDPACGCGNLLRASYQHLKQLQTTTPSLKSSLSIPSQDMHHQLLSQIWGVEINPFPAQLAMLSLAMADLSSFTNMVGILMEDFLELGPLRNYSVRTKNLQTGQVISRDMPRKFDVIIANPPYIKQEKIPRKKAMMKNLPVFASYRQSSTQSQKLEDIPVAKLELTGKTDYYGFFVWYSTYFLKSQGILCFLIPNKWMDVKYGEKLKSFLKHEYKLLALIGFVRNSFEHAQVSTMILLAQKEPNPTKRNEHYIKFIQVQDPQGHDRLRSMVYSSISKEVKTVVDSQGYEFQNDDPSFHVTIVKQETISPTKKWSYTYMYQSNFARKLQDSPLISLDTKIITTVVGGIKTGANAFFFLSKKDLEDFPVEPQFLRPGIRSGRTIPKSYLITSNSEQFLAIPAETSLLEYPNLAAYISNGQKTHYYPQRPSLHWKPWYSIPPEKQDSPDILFLRHIDRNFRARWNLRQCIVADGVRGITVQNPDHLLFYLGVCNSLYFYWQAHIYGRWEGQGDLQLLVYELRQFRIPDIRSISKAKITKVEQAMQALIDFDVQVSVVKTDDDPLQQALDLAVLDTLNLAAAYEVLKEETHNLESRRLSKKFQN